MLCSPGRFESRPPVRARSLKRNRKARWHWASIEAYTEVVFQNQPDERSRPDGLIIFDTVRRQWKALVEAKVGQGRISPEQLGRYYRLARANGIDAIITISNELTSRPQHIPYEVPDSVNGNIELYHWSWPHLMMVADNLLREEEDFDDEQHFILEEVRRYFDNETESWFQQMAPGWPNLIQRIFAGDAISGTEDGVLGAIKSWHQHQASICFWLGRELQRRVSVQCQPENFSSIPHGLWWALCTVTTVGYGDVYPITVGGRLFTFLVLIVGLGVIAVPTGLIASALTEVRKQESDKASAKAMSERTKKIR